MVRLRKLYFRVNENEYQKIKADADQESSKILSEHLRKSVLRTSEFHEKINKIYKISLENRDLISKLYELAMNRSTKNEHSRKTEVETNP